MNTTQVFSHIGKHIPLTPEIKAHLRALFQEEEVRKHEFLLRQGDPCQYIYFVNSGILRAYFVNPAGKDSTVMFAMKDWWITDMHCFLNGLPSMVNIQVVEHSSILTLSKNDLDTLYEEWPVFNKWFRILMQNAYCREQLRTIQNLSLPAKDRYERFLTKYPQIVQKVTLKQIASYLGITPEFLSAIRNQKS